MCGPAFTWGLYSVGRDGAGVEPCAWLPRGRAGRVFRDALGAARDSGQPARARTRGESACFGCRFLGARAAPRDAPRVPGQPRMRGGGEAADSRALLSPGCCCVARSIVVDRGSQTTVPALARPSNSSQVYVSRFRRACLADRAPNIFFGRAKFKLVLLNASSASRAASAHLRSRRAVHLSESRAGCVPSFAALTAALGHFTA